jgi:hypothetical protein
LNIKRERSAEAKPEKTIAGKMAGRMVDALWQETARQSSFSPPAKPLDRASDGHFVE